MTQVLGHKPLTFEEMKEMEQMYIQHDWEALRNQAAIAAMQGMLSNTDTINQYANDEAYKNLGSITDVVAKASVMYADALIEEIKHPKV